MNKCIAKTILLEVTVIAALLHDIGKSNLSFQARMTQKIGGGDYYRHEWLSLKMFIEMVKDCDTDAQWLTKLAQLNTEPVESQQIVSTITAQAGTDAFERATIDALPPLAQWVAWLIVTHHRLPPSTNTDQAIKKKAKDKLQRMFDVYTARDADVGNLYGLISTFDGWQKNLIVAKRNPELAKKSWQFDLVVTDSRHWRNEIAYWSSQALRNPSLFNADKTPVFTECITDPFLVYMSRMIMMLSDHNYSSLDIGDSRNIEGDDTLSMLCANTNRVDGSIKQSLDAHLIGVGKFTEHLTNNLPEILERFPTLQNHTLLASPTANERFFWQNEAYEAACDIREQSMACGYFGVNLASTGCGKTIGNARIMYGLADPDIGARFTVALGLRVLTLQTGQQFRENLQLTDKEVAVVVGGDASRKLFLMNQEKGAERSLTDEAVGSESSAALFTQKLNSGLSRRDYDGIETALRDEKANQMLLSPLVTCTIDHLMPACEGLRGGGYIAPALRLLSSDLVLDEPDDFSVEDLFALSRLVHTAGLLGSRVLLSSATLTPSMVKFLFDAYWQGRNHYNKNNNLPVDEQLITPCMFLDEQSSKPMVVGCTSVSDIEGSYAQFIDKRVAHLAAMPVRRKARILEVDDHLKNGDPEQVYDELAQSIIDEACALHDVNHEYSTILNKVASIGLIRIANTKNLVALAKRMASSIEVRDNTHIHFCCYHSRQILALRSSLEYQLDTILTRKGDDSLFDKDAITRSIGDSDTKHHIFIVLATSIAEVGRDHDYDWAIVEPSSMRSIIQLAGRVWRHRPDKTAELPNISLLQYNIRHLTARKGGGKPEPVFKNPGFESKNTKIASYDLKVLVSDDILTKIDSTNRIVESDVSEIAESLGQLEHNRLNYELDTTKCCVANSVWHKASTMYRFCTDIRVLTPFRDDDGVEEDWMMMPHREGLRFYYANAFDRNSAEYAENQNDILQYQYFNTEHPSVSLWLESDADEVLGELTGHFKGKAVEDIVATYFTVRLKEEVWQYNEFLGFFK